MAATHKTRTQSVGELMKGLCVNQAPQSQQEDVRRELRIQVERELRTELRPQVERALRVELRPQIEHALRQELLRKNAQVENTVPAKSSGKKPGAVKILAIILALMLVATGILFAVRMVTGGGWKEENGHYSYYKWDGTQLKNEWCGEDGCFYYFDEDGLMVTDFYEVDGTTYYFGESDGRMRTGWQRIGAGVYYFGESDGRMRTGKAIVDGVEYTFSERGKLVNWPSGKYPEVK